MSLAKNATNINVTAIHEKICKLTWESFYYSIFHSNENFWNFVYTQMVKNYLGISSHRHKIKSTIKYSIDVPLFSLVHLPNLIQWYLWLEPFGTNHTIITVKYHKSLTNLLMRAILLLFWFGFFPSQRKKNAIQVFLLKYANFQNSNHTKKKLTKKFHSSHKIIRKTIIWTGQYSNFCLQKCTLSTEQVQTLL